MSDEKRVIGRSSPAGHSARPLADALTPLPKAADTTLANALDTQRRLTGAVGAALMTVDPVGAVRLGELLPRRQPGSATPPWAAAAMAVVRDVKKPVGSWMAPLDDGSGVDAEQRPHLIFIPLRSAGADMMVAAYLIPKAEPATLRGVRQRLELTSGLFGLHELRRQIVVRDERMQRIRLAMEVLDAVNQQDRFRGAVMALCNEIASQWSAERVTIGLLNGRYVKACAISHTERFDRKMQLVQDIEGAMEECLDQEIEITHPRPDEATFVTRATEDLSRRHGPVASVSLPLWRHREPVGVLLVERAAEEPPTRDDIEGLRLVCELVTPRLVERRRYDRWIGARIAVGLGEFLGAIIGPKHTWAKLTAMAVLAFILFLSLARGEDHVDASFEITAIDQRVIPAPFEGRLQSVDVEPGHVVKAGETVLARLETAELQMRLAAARAERTGHLKERDLAMRDNELVERKMAEAAVEKADAEIALLEYELTQATLTAPIDGIVVHGDHKRKIGAPVETGDVLFEIAELENLRAELQVPEDRIADLTGDDGKPRRGELASVSHPGDTIPFEITHINPVAEVIDQQNVFRVKVTLLEDRPWLRPGMRGAARVNVGRRPYGVLWTRELINWIRMRLWV